MLSGDYLELYRRLSVKINKKRMFHSDLHTLAYGTDASFYRMTPRLVVKVKDEDEVTYLLKEASQLKISVTFRGAGTSLSGQSISDSVLVISGESWRNYSILDQGKKIRVQPGLTGAKVNKLLAPYNRKIGPDPASISSATIGGIVANNASGMCCDTTNNSYQTVEGIRIVFHDGIVLDTSNEQSKREFQEARPRIISEINKLAQSVQSNKQLANLIIQKFSIKNTTGYSLNALVDFNDPFDIIEHLLVGSEGTLGFISEITCRTIEDFPYKASAMIVFSDVEKACNAAIILKDQPVSTAELIDRTGLQTAQGLPGMPYWMNDLSDGAAALLVETNARSKQALENQFNKIKNSLKSIPVEVPLQFTDVASEYELYWKIRKGLFPSVCANRKTGTTVIIEDVAFPLSRLAEATLDLQELFRKYNYDEAVIFGHALAGNLHFVFTQDFSVPEEISRYENFISDLAHMVVKKFDGSLKAEHGTGRNMAPFVEFEWGKEAYLLMRQIKQIFDPDNLLNPGVIINDNTEIHIKNLKLLPPSHELIDKCTECGFCEPSCVSAGLTLSPRQRITVYRKISQLTKTGQEPHLKASLMKLFNYLGDETCATDGLCSLSCPVKIDTGKLIKELRFSKISKRQQKRAIWIAKHMSLVTSILRKFLSLVNFFHWLLGSKIMKNLTGIIQKIPGNHFPQWSPQMPKAAKKTAAEYLDLKNPSKVVYFPACINRTMGVSKDYSHEVQLIEKIQHLIRKAGYEIIFPENKDELCCGMAFSSKGYKEAGLQKSKQLESALWSASESGKFPILCDMSPCLYTMKENMEPRLKLYEPVEFILEFLMPNLDIIPVNETITVFPVCSLKKMGLEDKLIELAKLCATDVFVPETNCCGFAGDRGFTYPELNTHGLKDLKSQIPDSVTNGYSTSRTCEMGLSTHSGISFKSIVYLVDRVSKPKTNSKN